METFLITIYLLVLFVLAVYGFHRSKLLFLYLKHRRNRPQPAARFGELPIVTVQLPMFNERYVAERLIEACTAIDYPKDRLEIQVLDDSTDDTVQIAAKKVEDLVARGFDAVYIHRDDRTGFKAGALENGQALAKGDYILVFDADFVPGPNIVRDTIDFFTDPKVGMVQVRWGHINRDYSLLTRVQSMMLDGHFIIEHTARANSGRYFNFNGTAGIWRKSAIRDAGGWQHDTLTEDMDLSYRAQLRGWRFLYLPDVVAPAELPVEMNAFKSQQARWAKGSIQTARKMLPTIFRSDVPRKVKIEAFFHLTNNVAYLLIVALAMLLLPNLLVRTRHGIREVLLIDLPLFIGTTGSIATFYITSHREVGGTVWQALRRLPMLLSLGIGMSVNNARAVIEGLVGHQTEFVRTPKLGVGAGAEAGRGALLRTKKYRASKTIDSILELGLAAYFALTIAVAIGARHYVAVPFLALFLVGFAYVGTLSVHQAR